MFKIEVHLILTSSPHYSNLKKLKTHIIITILFFLSAKKRILLGQTHLEHYNRLLIGHLKSLFIIETIKVFDRFDKPFILFIGQSLIFSYIQ